MAARTESAAQVFREHISGPIVQGKCIACHVEGGVSGSTRLVFVRASESDHEARNLQAFKTFLDEVDDGADVILNKVQGVAHGGGVQVAAGTPEYGHMERFLRLLGQDVSSAPLTPQTLFDTVAMVAAAYGASTRFDDFEDPHEFKLSRMASYYRHTDGYEAEDDPVIDAYRVIDPGPLRTDYPQAGILNTKVFLQRYPTTATNRNRARSRWTYYHFLGLDVEKSASRTTDNEAFFEKYHRRMLVINAVDAQTNSHTVGIVHNWSGRNSDGYPTLTALLAAHYAPALPVPYLSFGGCRWRARVRRWRS